MEIWSYGLKQNYVTKEEIITISVELIYSLFSTVKQSQFITEFFTWMYEAMYYRKKRNLVCCKKTNKYM